MSLATTLIQNSNTSPLTTMLPLMKSFGTSNTEARITSSRRNPEEFYDGPIIMMLSSSEDDQLHKSGKGAGSAVALAVDCENQKSSVTITPTVSSSSGRGGGGGGGGGRRSMEMPTCTRSSSIEKLRASWHSSSPRRTTTTTPSSSSSNDKRVSIVSPGTVDKVKGGSKGSSSSKRESILSPKRSNHFYSEQPIVSPFRDPRRKANKSMRHLLEAPVTCSPCLGGGGGGGKKDRILTTKPPVELPDLMAVGPDDSSAAAAAATMIDRLPPLGGSASDHGILYTNKTTRSWRKSSETLHSLCSTLPPTKKESQNFVIKSCGGSSSEGHCYYTSVETPQGETLLTLDTNGTAGSLSSSFNSIDSRRSSSKSSSKDRRYIRDSQGELAAVIIHSVDDQRTHRYKICGGTPLYIGQRRSPGIHLYTWADVKNSTSGRGGLQYSMKLRCSQQDGGETNNIKFVSEHFGPSLFKWDTPRGFTIRKELPTAAAAAASASDDQQQQQQQHHPSARVAYMGNARGLVVAPNVDPCLMYCFVTIIDEMIEKRLR